MHPMHRKLLFAVPALLASGAALAHEGHQHTHGLLSGLAHPFGGADHLLAMIGVGLLAGMLGAGSRWRLPLAFLAAMALGALLGMAGIGGAPLEQVIALGVLALGLAIAFAARMRPALAIVLVAFCAVFHGHAHGVELPAQANAFAYVAGFVLSTAALHAVGLVLAQFLRARPVARVAGGAIALAGLVMVLV
jgi:urease accessory protein